MSLPEVPSRHFAAFKADLVKQLPDGLGGKVYAITGTTSGTGFVAARVVAELGGTVLLLNRASSRADKSLEELQAAVPEGKFVPIECDLQDFASVRAAAERIKTEYDALDCLACNAGVMGLSDKATKDGFDVQIQTNHLSHFLLTKELMELLEAAAEKNGEARVVQHSSEARKGSPLQKKYFERNGGNLGGDSAPWHGFGGPRFKRYHQSKLANIVFAMALADRLAQRGSKVKSLVCHPGASSTSLAGGLIEDGMIGGVMLKLSPMIMQSAEDGAMGLIKCMLATRNESGKPVENGDFYGPKSNLFKLQFPFTGEAALIDERAKYSQEQKDLLWRVSEEAFGEPFLLDTTLAHAKM